MSCFFDILQTAYATAYREGLKKKYTDPKIYHGGPSFDLTKRWYVYFSYQHPTQVAKNGNPVMKRQTPITLKVNRHYKTKIERLEQLKLIKSAVAKALKDGYTPYQNATQKEVIEYSIENALDFAHALKIGSLSETTIRDYKSRLRQFKNYLNSKGLLKRSVLSIDKSTINEFLNSILKSSSARNRNNTRMVLSAYFTVLEENDIIPKNFIKNIKPLKSNPQRNKTYTLKMVDQLYQFLSEKDPQLLLFIKLVSYNFLRPIEVCRLKVADINIEQQQLYVKAKNKLVKTKIIPNIIIDELKKLNLTNSEDYIITPNGVGPWHASEVNKRDYFSKRFKKIKITFNEYLEQSGDSNRLGKDHTVYSFRHTFITKLYRQLRSQYSQTETYDQLMLITGHATLKALVSYLRDIDAELPEDYSKFLK